MRKRKRKGQGEDERRFEKDESRSRFFRFVFGKDERKKHRTAKVDGGIGS